MGDASVRAFKAMAEAKRCPALAAACERELDRRQAMREKREAA